MDLLEVTEGSRRHPWELARARAIARIVESHTTGATVRSILDWGCGDGYTGRFLLDRLRAESMVGVDVHLTEQQRQTLTHADRRVRLLGDAAELGDESFDLLLFCDVIEHVADDKALVEHVVSRFLRKSGHVIVTVPAFQSLFSNHDLHLKHFRRYNLAELEGVLGRAGLEVTGSGYLFGSLLPARAATRLMEAVRPVREPPNGVGIGRWKGGPAITRLTEALLGIDNSLLLALADRGVKPPGLSVWASCRKLA